MRMYIPTVLAALTLMSLAVGCAPEAPPAKTSSAAGASAGDASPWLEDYQLALKRAAAEKKPILAVFSGSDFCTGCIELKRVVFDSPEFGAWAERTVVLLELDLPLDKPQPKELRRQNEQLYESLGANQFPAIFFLDAGGRKIGQMDQIPLPAQPWIAAANAILGL